MLLATPPLPEEAPNPPISYTSSYSSTSSASSASIHPLPLPQIQTSGTFQNQPPGTFQNQSSGTFPHPISTKGPEPSSAAWKPKKRGLAALFSKSGNPSPSSSSSSPSSSSSLSAPPHPHHHGHHYPSNPGSPATPLSVSSLRGENEDGSGEEPILTRPPQLPPKNPEETKKHLQMVQEMIRLNEEKDRRRNEEQRRRNERREQILQRNTQIWQNEILPFWEEKKDSKKTQELVEEGIPPKFRGKVWGLCVGNDLNITEQLFSICLERAKKALSFQKSLHQKEKEKAREIREGKGPREEREGEREERERDGEGPEKNHLYALGREDTVELIATDLTRTFPSLGFFQVGGPLYEPLKQVLEAYVCYRPDVGYVQGMSFLASMLLLNMDTFSSFAVLCNMLNRKCHLGFFQMDPKKISAYKQTFDVLFAELLPALHSHFTRVGIESDLFLVDWFLTLFARSLPLETAARIWDAYFLQGEVYLFRTAVAILKVLEKRFLGQPFDVIAYDLTHLPTLDEDRFFHVVNSIQLPERKFHMVSNRFLKL